MATTRKSRKQEIPCTEFTAVQDFIRTYHAVGHDDQSATDFLTIWAMGTWTFSEASPMRPYTYPYAYITGEYGSGKSLLGRDIIGAISRRPEKIVETTGPALFRLMGDFDAETGEVENHYSTLLIDEVDAAFNGPKNEPLRAGLNEGYKNGATIPRAMGKRSIRFPVYGPKLLMGADNGHLPDSVVTRTIRVDLKSHPRDELTAMGIQEMFPWDTEDRIAELSGQLAEWGKSNAMVLREYNPEQITGLTGRQWEIARSIVQLAKAAGVEQRVTRALVDLFSRQPKKVDARTALYTAIFEVFEDNDTTKVTTRMILEHLRECGIGVPGGSGKGLASVLSGDGIQPTYIRIDKSDHPAYVEGKYTHRGYHRYQFDGAFVAFLPDESELCDDNDDE